MFKKFVKTKTLKNTESIYSQITRQNINKTINLGRTMIPATHILNKEAF